MTDKIFVAVKEKKEGICPKCGKKTDDWYHIHGTGHTTGDFSNDLFCCEKCWLGGE